MNKRERILARVSAKEITKLPLCSSCVKPPQSQAKEEGQMRENHGNQPHQTIGASRTTIRIEGKNGKSVFDWTVQETPSYKRIDRLLCLERKK